MKISIVTPSYNQGALLEKTIKSVLGSEPGDYELEYIIVDGGSSDGSRELIELNAGKLAWWCSKPDGGQYAAINEGFGHSSGEIMGWLNASDLYFPYTLKTVERIFEQNPSIDWITAQSKVTINEIGDLAYFGTALGYSRRAFRAGLHSGADNFGFIQQESCFWRRKLWDKIGGRIPDQCRFAADFHLWSLFFEHAPLAAVGALWRPFATTAISAAPILGILRKYLRCWS